MRPLSGAPASGAAPAAGAGPRVLQRVAARPMTTLRDLDRVTVIVPRAPESDAQDADAAATDEPEGGTP